MSPPHTLQQQPASFNVRSARISDAEQLSTLLQQLGENDPLPDPALLAQRLAALPDNSVVLVAEYGERLLGTCTLHLIEHLAHNFARSAIIEDVVVDAAQRGLGIGRALLNEATAQANAWGCYKLALSTRRDREAAQHFYAELGYRQHGLSLALPLEP